MGDKAFPRFPGGISPVPGQIFYQAVLADFNSITPSDHNGLERLAQYIIRAPISQERMIYIPATEAADGIARVIYQAKDGGSSKTFLAIDWLAHLITHIPNKGNRRSWSILDR